LRALVSPAPGNEVNAFVEDFIPGRIPDPVHRIRRALVSGGFLRLSAAAAPQSMVASSPTVTELPRDYGRGDSVDGWSSMALLTVLRSPCSPPSPRLGVGVVVAVFAAGGAGPGLAAVGVAADGPAAFVFEAVVVSA
jgi:hypothetical protein